MAYLVSKSENSATLRSRTITIYKKNANFNLLFYLLGRYIVLTKYTNSTLILIDTSIMIQIVFTIIWFMKTENIIYYILKNHKQRSFSEVLVPHFNELIYKFLQKSPADAFNWGHLPHVFLQNDKKSDKSFEISIYHFICLLHTIFFTILVCILHLAMIQKLVDGY